MKGPKYFIYKTKQGHPHTGLSHTFTRDYLDMVWLKSESLRIMLCRTRGNDKGPFCIKLLTSNALKLYPTRI